MDDQQRLLMPKITSGSSTNSQPVEYQVVGVFHDILDDEHLTGTTQPEMYVSLWQIGWRYVAFGVRTSVDPMAVTGGLRSAVASVAPGMSINQVEMMQQVVDGQRNGDRFGMTLFGGFAAVLVVVSIYGLLAWMVAQRSGEIAIRMALGARAVHVLRLVSTEACGMVVAGLVLGIAGAFAAGPWMRGLLYGTKPTDPGIMAMIAGLVLLVTALATLIPAVRATRVEPAAALRE